MKKSLFHIGIVGASLLQISCIEQVTETNLPYDLSHPVKSYKLPKALEEISGLAYAGDNSVYCVQDEDGLVYLYDCTTEQITTQIHFAKDNDYEGIALVNEEIYVLESNGTLYSVLVDEQGDNVEVNKITTFLDRKYDTEGLCYDEQNSRLLIACKGKADKDPQSKDRKAVYAFDLVTQTLQEQPAFMIDLETVQRVKRTGATQEAYEEVSNFLGQNNLTFNPSAIAIHPMTKDLYILSSAGKTLVVMSDSGDIQCAVHLKKSNFKQPEGITFDEEGTMYISNEGHGGTANIKVFRYAPNNESNEREK